MRTVSYTRQPFSNAGYPTNVQKNYSSTTSRTQGAGVDQGYMDRLRAKQKAQQFADYPRDPHVVNPSLPGVGGGGGGGSTITNNLPQPPRTVRPETVIQTWRNNLLPRPAAPARPAPVAEIPYIDDTAAVQAAYNRAKDTAGQTGRAALNALMDVQGARGLLQGGTNSGLGINEAGGLINAQAQMLADVNREQMIQRIENERQRQFANYQGRLNQRGQDMSFDTNIFGNEIGMRGQDYSFLPAITSLYRLNY